MVQVKHNVSQMRELNGIVGDILFIVYFDNMHVTIAKAMGLYSQANYGTISPVASNFSGCSTS